MSRINLALLVLLAACSSPPPVATSPQSHREGQTARPERIQPSDGADIDPAVLQQLALDQVSSASAATGVDLELGADRPLLAIDVPRVARMTTTSFTFGDARRGWITRLPMGGVIPSVAYGGGRVYVGGGFETTAFYALDARSGKMLWTRQALADNGPTAPSYLDEEVIFNTESCTLFVLDARTGRTRWSRWLGDPTLAQPAVNFGLIFASYPSDAGGQRLAGLRLKDGRTVWSRVVDGELLTAPVVSGDSVYATTIRGSVYRFEATRGKRRWRSRIRATSAPWVEGGKVYLGRDLREGRTRSEAQVVLDAETGATVAVLRQARAPYLRDVPRSLDSWPKVWAFEGSRPLLVQGRLLDTMAGAVSATHPVSGQSLWRRRHGGTAARRTLTPPVVAGSQVVFATREGAVYALDVDTGMTVFAYDLKRRITSSPVVAHGWLYLSSNDGSVIAIEAGGAGLDGWHMWGGGPGHNGPRS